MMPLNIIGYIFKFLLCIVVFLIGGAFVKILLDLIRGKSKTNILKEKDIKDSDLKILEIELSRIKGYHKIFRTNKFLVYINEYHIDLILLCNYYGMLTGNENDEYWQFNSDLEKSTIVNPIYELEKIKENLIKKTGINKIRMYILLGSNTRLNVKISKINVIRRNNAYFTLSKRNEKKKYTQNEVDLMYKKIKM